jgi:DNA-binding NtrC family response regulator
LSSANLIRDYKKVQNYRMKKNYIIKKEPDLQGLNLLIIEKTPELLKKIEKRLTEYGAQVFSAISLERAVRIFSEYEIHAVLACLDLKGERGIDILETYKSIHPDGLFYVMTEYPSFESAIETAKRGVDDYFQKPVDIRKFALNIEGYLKRFSTGEQTSLALPDPLSRKLKPFFLFRSPAMRLALAMLPKIAASDQTVLISGETGTGKEMVSRAIHMLSARADGPFVALNTGAIPEGLIEGELFGHEKGSFTGAQARRKGKFELAHGGTLFLDEIGDMPLQHQIRLLRALEEGVIYRVGGEQPVPVNVRVIAASRRNLEDSVEDGLFRDDLYYRLNVLRIHIPPLRDRKEDISYLSIHFLERAFNQIGRPYPYPNLAPETFILLEQLPWKGNVRQLRNLMTRVATLLPDNARQVLPVHIIPHIKEGRFPHFKLTYHHCDDGIYIPIGTSLKKAEEIIIDETLKHTKGNRTKAASILGIGIRTLRRKLNK